MRCQSFQVLVKCWTSVDRELETLPPRVALEVCVHGNAFKSISKEISMEINHLLKAGFGRRGFLSGSSLLLTGALLGAAPPRETYRSPPPRYASVSTMIPAVGPFTRTLPSNSRATCTVERA